MDGSPCLIYRHGRRQGDAVALTFDDGYVDNYEVAFPLLKRYGMVGTFFVTTSFVGRSGYMTWEQLAEIASAGMAIEAHSVTHADLTTLDAAQLAEEVGGSRKTLRRDFPGEPVDFFAYPYGRWDPDATSAVREAGFLGALTTRRGAASLDGDGPFTLDRMIVTGTYTPKRLLREVRATSRRR